MSDVVAERRDTWAAAHARVARGLFEACGREGAESADDVASALLTSLAGQFAWHAELLVDLLPLRDGVDREALVERAASATTAIDALLGSLDDTTSLCVGLARVVLPRLASSLTGERRATDGRLEGPRVRALTLIARDVADACCKIEPVCERLLADGRHEVLARVADLEMRLVAAGVSEGVVNASSGWSP